MPTRAGSSCPCADLTSQGDKPGKNALAKIAAER